MSVQLLMLALLVLQGLGVSEEAVLQLTHNTNLFIAQGSLLELTAGQGDPGPILAAGAAKLQPPHVTRLPHRYTLGRGGHVEVGLTLPQAPQCSDAQVLLAPSLQEWPSCSRCRTPSSLTGTRWPEMAMLRWAEAPVLAWTKCSSFTGSS